MFPLIVKQGSHMLYLKNKARQRTDIPVALEVTPWGEHLYTRTLTSPVHTT